MKPLTEKQQADADELELYAVNTGELYFWRTKIIEAMTANIKAGSYKIDADGCHPAYYYADWFRDAAKRYRREIGQTSHWFSRTVVEACARELARQDYDRIINGEYDK